MTFLIPALYAAGLLSIEGLYGLIFLTSVVSTVFGPALVSAVPLLVRPSELMSANALIQGTNNIGMLLGPAISGIMIALIDAENVLFVNSATFLISALCLMPIRFTVPQARAAESASSMWEELKVGFRFVFGQQSIVFTLVIISSLYNLGVSTWFHSSCVRQRVSSSRPCAVGVALVRSRSGDVGGFDMVGLEEAGWVSAWAAAHCGAWNERSAALQCAV